MMQMSLKLSTKRGCVFLRLAAALGVFAGTIAILVPVMDHIVLNGTPSVEASVLWKTHGRTIAKGDYVMAPVRHDLLPPQYSHLTKRALCAPGDWLSFDGRTFRCNGAALNTVKPETRAGLPLEPFTWTDGAVPAGKMFVGSSHPDGFDSRYLGLFSVEDLTRLEPLI